MTMTGQDHPFDAATRLTGGNGRYQGHTAAGYANMVGPFGGIIAAVMLRASLDHPERLGDPLALTVNFAAPLADGSFDIDAVPVRTNRSTQHWNIGLTQKGLTMATASAVFANRRMTWSSTEMHYPALPAVHDGVRISDEHFPAWVRQYDIRVLQGGIPPSLTIEHEEAFTRAVSLQWICDEPRRPLDFLSLAAICDTFFPRIYIRRNQFVPAGTVSLSIYFHVSTGEFLALGDKPVLGSARANRFHDNYFDQTAEVWSQDRELLATSSQIVYFKE